MITPPIFDVKQFSSSIYFDLHPYVAGKRPGWSPLPCYSQPGRQANAGSSTGWFPRQHGVGHSADDLFRHVSIISHVNHAANGWCRRDPNCVGIEFSEKLRSEPRCGGVVAKPSPPIQRPGGFLTLSPPG